MAIVQRIDFVLNLKQILEMCVTEPNTNGIRLTLGVTDKAEIVFTTDGVFWDGKELKSTSKSFGPCPIPPDCPKQLDCIKNLNEFMSSAKKVSEFINLGKANDFLNS